MTTPLLSYKGHRYPVEIINHCVWLYFRFTLSFRDGEERCSNAVSRSATRRSGGGAPSSGRPTPTGCADARPRPGDKWNLDEVFIRINGTQHYLWRAVDQHGIEGLEYVPRVIVTDKLGSYRGAPRVAGRGRAPPVEVFEHPRRELASTDPTARAGDETLRITRVRAAVPVRVQRHLATLPAPPAPTLGDPLA